MLFEQLPCLYIDGTAYSITQSRPHKGFVLCKLEGIDSLDQAMTLKNKVVYLDRDQVELEDGAYFIADIIGFIDGHNPEDYVTLTEMAKAAIHMVTESIDAYVKHDTILAEKVVDEDDIVDEYFLQVKSKLIAKIAKDPDDGEYALDLLMIAKYFERIGDHAVNIAEWVIFSVTGVHRGE